MTRQIEIFPEDPCQGFYGDNPESRAAFENKILPHLTSLQKMVLEFANLKPLTVKSVRYSLDLQHQTASARLTELKKMELLMPTEERRDGCRVLEITSLGRRTLREWQKKY